MDPNGMVVGLAGAGLLIHGPAQAPHSLAPGIAAVAGLPVEKVHLIAPAVGGGFGAKMDMYVEYGIAV